MLLLALTRRVIPALQLSPVSCQGPTKIKSKKMAPDPFECLIRLDVAVRHHLPDETTVRPCYINLKIEYRHSTGKEFDDGSLKDVSI